MKSTFSLGFERIEIITLSSVCFLALKLKMNKGRVNETYTPKKLKKKQRKNESQKNGAKDAADGELDKKPPFSLVSHVNSILLSFFLMLSCTPPISKFTIPMGCMA